MKKTISILLIALLLFNSCGYFFVYFELSSYFKKEASAKINEFIPDFELEVLSFHKFNIESDNSPLKFFEADEFSYNGSLYDVYKIEYKNDTISYYCLNDKNENILEQAFSNYLENKTKNDAKNNPINNILNNIMKIGIVPSEFNNSYFQSSIKFVTKSQIIHTQYPVDIPTPPPKFLT